MNEILVLYAYYEKDGVYKNNLELFLRKGIHTECDYVFIVNGQSTVSIPNASNIKVLYKDNEDYDFGAYNHALNNIKYDQYKHIFFMNTSVRGPFIPPYVAMKWYEPFINMLSVNDVKLVGTTINVLSSPTQISRIFENYSGFSRPHTHVQTQFFAMDKECLDFLLSKDLFSSKDYNNFTEFIAMKELMMSQLVLRNGWNINAIVAGYNGIDYRTLKEDVNFSGYEHDPGFTNTCFGRTIHPYECIFIKTNRGLCPNEINSLSQLLQK
jgi:lipopolysaccharide biosynthesis protein